MSHLNEFYMESADNKNKLHVMQWQPDDGNSRAVLQVVHGIAEHIARYDAFARFMADNGFTVIGNSHLGHGLSAPDETCRGVFAEDNGWHTAICDMHGLYEKTHGQNPRLPYFMLGHSMGSFMTRTFLIRYPELLTGCILSGTGQQSGILVGTGRIAAGIEKKLNGTAKPSDRLNRLSFGAYNRRIPNNQTPYDWLSRDSETVLRYESDKACGFAPSAGMFSDMLGGIQFIGKKKNISKMRKALPILFISGDQDPVGDYGKGTKKVYDLFTEVGLTDLSFNLYEGARHEVLNEINRLEIYDDVLQWIKQRLPDTQRTNLYN